MPHLFAYDYPFANRFSGKFTPSLEVELRASRERHMIILAAMLAAGSNILELRDAYSNCVKTQAVRLGTGNTETADTILRAVSSICQPQWTAVEMAFPSGTGVLIAEQARTNALRNWRSQAEDAAIAALLEARAAQRTGVPAGK